MCCRLFLPFVCVNWTYPSNRLFSFADLWQKVFCTSLQVSNIWRDEACKMFTFDKLLVDCADTTSFSFCKTLSVVIERWRGGKIKDIDCGYIFSEVCFLSHSKGVGNGLHLSCMAVLWPIHPVVPLPLAIHHLLW